MKYRDPAKNYDVFSALSSQRKNRSHKRGILKLREVIDWAAFGPLLEELAGYRQKDAKKEGPPHPLSRCSCSRCSSCRSIMG